MIDFVYEHRGVAVRLVRVDVRFFRSFNYDYERKESDDAVRDAWEAPGPWFPFVRVPLESDITAIVGANEAGKSQLVTAIKALLTGDPIERSDFCRYSPRYSVAEGEIRYPEFGGHFKLDPGETLGGVIDATNAEIDTAQIRDFEFYRPGREAPFLVVNGKRVELANDGLKKLEAQFPLILQPEVGVAIPDTVSISALAGDAPSPIDERDRRSKVLDIAAKVQANTPDVAKHIVEALNEGSGEAAEAAKAKARKEFNLARALLVEAAGISQSAFRELKDAISDGKEGHVEALIGAMNRQIAQRLNIQRWWSQDKAFELRVEPREHELAFTIQDRTTARYSFGERSQGLRYFLSYFVQLHVHAANNNRPGILLFDEPDAYLSSVGQQDLLRVLQDYAHPATSPLGQQVVYVTHSPFLIDKNAPHRIRVLDKGSQEEGTRVVRDAANNRYEPLRSSLGAYVGETAFIGGQNLFVEGLADQLLLAGISMRLRRDNSADFRALDLNNVTIVACGGASNIPYMAYLARGRDTIKPPCVALLDGDHSGKDAAKALKRGEAQKKRVLADEYIVGLDTWAAESGADADQGVLVEEIEDLLPADIAIGAARNFLGRFRTPTAAESAAFTVDELTERLAVSHHVWDALKALYEEAFTGEHLEKVGLAREVVALLLDDDPDFPGVSTLLDRFTPLLDLLGNQLRHAAKAENEARSSNRVKRAVKSFTSDFTDGIRKIDALDVLTELLEASQDTDFDDAFRSRVTALIKEHELKDYVSPNVANFPQFRQQVQALATFDERAYRAEAAAGLQRPTDTIQTNSAPATPTVLDAEVDAEPVAALATGANAS